MARNPNVPDARASRPQGDRVSPLPGILGRKLF
jgi:hypothetical protein